MKLFGNFKTGVGVAVFILFAGNVSRAMDISYVGDSQSAYPYGLFDKLQPLLFNVGNIKSAVAVCGARIQGYTDKVQYGSAGCDRHLVAKDSNVSFQLKPGRTTSVDRLANDSDVVIVQLGDNHLGDIKSVGGLAAKMATRILEKGKQCIWIGPASVGKSKKGKSCARNRSKKEAVSNAIKLALERTVVYGNKCTFIDSFSLTRANPPPGDEIMCLHYGSKYSMWSDAIGSSLKNALQENLNLTTTLERNQDVQNR